MNLTDDEAECLAEAGTKLHNLGREHILSDGTVFQAPRGKNLYSKRGPCGYLVEGNKCGLYSEDGPDPRRPQVCNKFPVGSPSCNACRTRMGLPAVDDHDKGRVFTINPNDISVS